ncbi:hypothetical protein JTE90_022092 [Oedothorax gibbosus]|uniref:Uncharacterized protein n=1 Tax=Oedothorax gibbosus TaxID=931172 RepID=A0AAV6TZB0_9ARAC|nr:hypothetical protein JTE90_022092 [Oedothorax gibbosus]
MASCSTSDWRVLSQDVSGEPTLEQPRSCLKHALKKSRLEVRQREDRPSWCQSVFCGSKKNKKVVSAFAGSTRSLEVQNSECMKIVEELNNCLAVFRDHLVHIAKPQDCAEIRDRIKETRRKCLELVVSANEIIMPQIRSDVAEGIPVDSQQLVNLVCCTQLFLRELKKCYNLIQSYPIDMTPYYEKKPKSGGVSVLDKLVLFKLQPRDYHAEELQSILRDTNEIIKVLREMKEFMPCESNDKILLDENLLKWNKRTRKSVCRFAEDWTCYCGTNLS